MGCRRRLKYQAIAELREDFSVTILCLVAKVSRASFYKWLTKKPIYKEELEVITHEQMISGFTLGYRTMQYLLKNEYGIKIGRNRLLSIMRRHDLLSKVRRKRPDWVAGKYENVRFPNRLGRKFHTDKPCQKLVTDMTYVPIPNSMVYLAVILDLYNNEVISYQLSERPNKELMCSLVENLTETHDVTGALLHSDQGVQYANKVYSALLASKGIIQSMSRRGNCWDNAVAEAFFGNFKCECIYPRKRSFQKFADVEEAINDYIHNYNHRRPQQKLNGLSPLNFRLNNF